MSNNWKWLQAVASKGRNLAFTPTTYSEIVDKSPGRPNQDISKYYNGYETYDAQEKTHDVVITSAEEFMNT